MDICKPKTTYELALPGYFDVPTAISLCSKLGQGTLPQPSSLQAWQAVWDSLAIYGGRDNLHYAWLAYSRANSTAEVLNVYEPHEPISLALWIPGQPYGAEYMCVMCERAGCYVDNCARLFSAVCQFSVIPPMLALRGLCRNSDLHIHFYPRMTAGGQFCWIGQMGTTFVRYDKESVSWVARVVGSPVTARSEASLESLSLGLQDRERPLLRVPGRLFRLLGVQNLGCQLCVSYDSNFAAPRAINGRHGVRSGSDPALVPLVDVTQPPDDLMITVC